MFHLCFHGGQRGIHDCFALTSKCPCWLRAVGWLVHIIRAVVIQHLEIGYLISVSINYLVGICYLNTNARILCKCYIHVHGHKTK